MNEITVSATNIEAFLKAGNSDFINTKVIALGFTLGELERYQGGLYSLLYYANEIVIRDCGKGVLEALIALGLNASVEVIESDLVRKEFKVTESAETITGKNHLSKLSSYDSEFSLIGDKALSKVERGP